MNKKIIIIINNLGVGGAERVVVDDINEMLRLGIDVTLITLRPEPLKSFITELRLQPNNFLCIPFKHFCDIPAWVRVVRSIRKAKPNLVITQLWFSNTIGRIASRMAGVKNIISFEQNIYDTLKTRKMFFVDRCLQFLSFRIVAVSKAVKKSLVQHSIQETKIDIIYNSIDPRKFVTHGDSSKLRTEYSIPEAAFLFIFVGRLIHQKAVDILIEAFEKIDPTAYLLIVGQGVSREILERKAKEGGLGKRVIFTGVRTDIPQLLSWSDCFVLPSRYEGLPLVLVEALAAGIAVIGSDF